MTRLLLAAAAIIVSFVSGLGAGHIIWTTPATYSAPCTFDGGGTIRNGTFATTDTGTWVCSDGELIHVTILNP